MGLGPDDYYRDDCDREGLATEAARQAGAGAEEGDQGDDDELHDSDVSGGQMITTNQLSPVTVSVIQTSFPDPDL